MELALGKELFFWGMGLDLILVGLPVVVGLLLAMADTPLLNKKIKRL
ncbi:MAG: hypothetical protein HQM04_10415 [Magnetococcales bacterium]|nr:hypothetical protein [Magnetococcales bacterium]MBF0115442.1 hypothetical protein [Magnetococcales bacterium]